MDSLLSLPALAAGVLGHAVLFFVSRKRNALFLLAAACLVITQLSVSCNIPGVQALKYVRLYACFLIVVIGVGGFGVRLFRPTSNALMPFVIWYLCAGLWSASPFWGVVWKSLFLCALLGGLVLAWGTRDRMDLTEGLRLLVLATGVLAFASIQAAIANPADSLRGERLSVGGICANTMAVNSAMGLVLALHMAFSDRSGWWRAVAAAMACGHAAVIMAAGSRTGSVLGLFALLLYCWPLLRRPMYLLATAAIIVVVGLSLAAQVDNEKGLDRILNESWEKRVSLMYLKVQAVDEARYFGRGAVVISGRDFHGLDSVNSHNLYIQIAVELGLVGLALFLAGIVVVAYRAARTYRRFRHDGRFALLAFLPLAILGMVLLEGMGSSATLGSVQYTTLLLGFAVGLVDRLPELAARENRLPAAARGLEPAAVYNVKTL